MSAAETAPSPFEKAARMVNEEMRNLGVEPSPERHEQLSDSELLEMSYYEKAREKGLL